jgi:hypothetical protein
MISLSLQAFRSVTAIVFLFQAALPFISRMAQLNVKPGCCPSGSISLPQINGFCLNLAASGQRDDG